MFEQRGMIIACAPRSRFPGLITWLLVAAISPSAQADLTSGPQYDALKSIHNATGGATWTDSTNWASGDACMWHGVGCDQDDPGNNASQVRYLSLSNNNLSGVLPDFSGLIYLINLDLSSNKLTGSFPDISGMVALNAIDLSHNLLDGTIPAISGVPDLRNIVAGFNQLHGSLPCISPTAPCNSGLTSLSSLSLSTNLLTGVIPSFEGLDFQELDLSHNLLEGSIPPLDQLAGATYIDLSANRLTGQIPCLSPQAPCNSHFYQLATFNLESNALSGPIPDLAGMPFLRHLLLAGNSLTGPVPAAPIPTPGKTFDATLCPNPLDSVASANDAGWNAATGFTPWWTSGGGAVCDGIFASDFE